MIGFLTPLATEGISYAYGFVFFGTNLAAAALVWFFLLESRMLSLENVDLMYSQEGLQPWRSSKWVPPGYITREQRDDTHVRNVGGHSPGEKDGSDSNDAVDEDRRENA